MIRHFLEKSLYLPWFLWSMPFKVITFYKYIGLESPEKMRDAIRHLCTQLNILGRILIAPEGINGAVSGNAQEILMFKKYLHSQTCFSDITFRENTYTENPYHKLVVRVRKEIVVFGTEVDLQHTGTYLSPQELHQWYEQHKEFVIIDARNAYEHAVGTFKNSRWLPIENFREFPAAVTSLEPLKKKTVVTYCTGGIRCEKASAYLKQHGFEKVYQLQGGILDYLKQFPDGYFEGNCFVFDDKLVAPIAKGALKGRCKHCSAATNTLINCHNIDCDELFYACNECLEKMSKTCSDTCKASPRWRKERRKKYINQ